MPTQQPKHELPIHKFLTLNILFLCLVKSSYTREKLPEAAY